MNSSVNNYKCVKCYEGAICEEDLAQTGESVKTSENVMLKLRCERQMVIGRKRREDVIPGRANFPLKCLLQELRKIQCHYTEEDGEQQEMTNLLKQFADPNHAGPYRPC